MGVLEVIDPVGAAASFGPPFGPLSSRSEALSATAARTTEHGVDLAIACRHPAVAHHDAEEDLDRHRITLLVSHRVALPRSSVRMLTRTIRRGAAISTAAVLGVGFNAATIGAAVEPPRVVDRTFGCIPEMATGKLRALDVTAVPRGSVEARDPFAPRSPGFLGVSTGGLESASELVAVRANRWQRFARGHSAAGVFVSRGCRASRTAVALSRKGLAGLPTRWVKNARCLNRGRVIIRVRAVLSQSDPWRSLVTGSVDGATGTVVSAAVAVRSEQTGKPLAYMALTRDGTTKLWFASGCNR